MLNIQKELLEIKEQAGNPKYISCFGKTFVEKDAPEYQTSKDIGEIIVDNGFGIMHGGYIGTMEAVSEGANISIQKDQNKNENWNIGVPMKTFDKDLKRADCKQLSASDNILDRKRILVENCDACVVLPIGGIGTLLEVIEIFHINQINTKFGGEIKPIIFYGKIWKELMDTISDKLDLKGQSDGSSFVTFINSLDELKEALKSL